MVATVSLLLTFNTYICLWCYFKSSFYQQNQNWEFISMIKDWQKTILARKTDKTDFRLLPDNLVNTELHCRCICGKLEEFFRTFWRTFWKFKQFMRLWWGSEFSSYWIELQNFVTQNDVTLQFTNLKVFIEILLSKY